MHSNLLMPSGWASSSLAAGCPVAVSVARIEQSADADRRSSPDCVNRTERHDSLWALTSKAAVV